MPAQEITLDVRELEPPRPYELATAAVAALERGQYVRMISRRRPRLLYPWLTQRGFAAETRQRGEELFEIFIWSAQDEETARVVRTIDY